MNTPAIEIVGLVKEYVSVTPWFRGAVRQNRRSLDGIDLVVARGERVGIIGANGSGKTTLLRCIAGILAPTKGSVAVHGTSFYASGFGTALAKSMTVTENLRVLSAIAHVDGHHSIDVIESVLRESDLMAYAHAPVRELSSGMISRLAFFALLGMRPPREDDVLLLDEATTLAGDEVFRLKAKEALARRVGSGATAVIASHSLDSLIDTCDRIVWIHEGKIAMDGVPREVVDAYRAAARVSKS